MAAVGLEKELHQETIEMKQHLSHLVKSKLIWNFRRNPSDN